MKFIALLMLLFLTLACEMDKESGVSPATIPVLENTGSNSEQSIGVMVGPDRHSCCNHKSGKRHVHGLLTTVSQQLSSLLQNGHI